VGLRVKKNQNEMVLTF